jgi:hypothetical protein
VPARPRSATSALVTCHDHLHHRRLLPAGLTASRRDITGMAFAPETDDTLCLGF